MKRLTAYTLIVSMQVAPVWAAPLTTNTSNSYSTNSGFGGTASGGFAVSLGNAPQSTTFLLGKAGGGVTATPITCNLQSIAANYNAQADFAKLGKEFEQFLKTSAQNYAVNHGMEAGASAYAHNYCTSPAGATEIAANVKKRTLAVQAKARADAAQEVAKLQNQILLSQRSVLLTSPGTMGPDPLAMQGVAQAQAQIATIEANSGLIAKAEMKRIQDEEFSKCIEGAKNRFNDYVLNSLQILNGNFWKQVSLEAEQCALEKNLSESNPSKGLFDFLGKTNTKDKDFGLFTVRVSGSGDGLEIKENSKRKSDVNKEAVARTSRTVEQANQFTQNVLSTKDQMDKWLSFKADWDAAKVVADPIEQEKALNQVFDNYPINGEFAKNPAYADYWISMVYYDHIANQAKADMMDQDKYAAKDATSELAKNSITQASLLVELKKMRKQSLLQTQLLAELVKDRVNGSGAASGSGNNGVTTVASTTGEVNRSKVSQEIRQTQKDMDTSLQTLLDAGL